MSKNITAAAQVIPFRKAELLLVDYAGEPVVPMRPVVQGMGLDWKTQYRKLQGGRFNTCMVEMTTQLPGDTQARAVSCLLLRKLPGWLMSIHPNKVRPELREGIIAYQNECDDVLWSYWNKGHAERSDDRTIETVLSSTIGTDGFHCLAAVLDGKVRYLPAPIRKRAKQHVWSQVHKAFSVVSAEDIPAAKLDAARNFIAAYVIDGEWLGREEKSAFAITEPQLAQIGSLLHSVAWVWHRWNQGISQGVAALNPGLYAMTRGHVEEMARLGRVLDRDLASLLASSELYFRLGGMRPLEGKVAF